MNQTSYRTSNSVLFVDVKPSFADIEETTLGLNPESISEKRSQQVLTLPLYPNMAVEEKDYLVDSISEFFKSR